MKLGLALGRGYAAEFMSGLVGKTTIGIFIDYLSYNVHNITVCWPWMETVLT